MDSPQRQILACRRATHGLSPAPRDRIGSRPGPRTAAIDDDTRTVASDLERPAEAASSEPGSAGVVFVVDDDEAVRDSLGLLLRSVGHRTELFDSANAFLEAFDAGRRGCLVLDVRMPGMSGLDLQRELSRRGAQLPIVFITGHGDVPMAVRAMQDGAVDFLEKPFKEQDLLDRISGALAIGSRRRRESDEEAAIADRHASLTPREREVLDLVVEGIANKVIASRLGASRRTIEIHRANVMRKMEADSLAHLVRMTMRLRRGGPAGSASGG